MRLRRSGEGPARGRAPTARRGFTLLELMIVTLILGVLVALAAKPVMEMREQAMVAATKADLSNALQAIGRYRIVHGRLPNHVDQLERVGYRKSHDTRYCDARIAAPGARSGARGRGRGRARGRRGRPGAQEVRLSATHRRSSTLVEAYYPSGRMTTSERGEGQCDDAGRGPPRGKGPPEHAGPPPGRGPPGGPPGRP